ncbi:MAG: hypothetical protein RI894_271 [Bacteroidota bacterium]|jgi:histidyl-tRNA synthetase
MKPSLPSGFRDFAPDVLRKRNYIFDTIKKVFNTFGYDPIETPSLENLNTLTGKYGEEGDTLLYKVLNSGDFLRKAKNIDNYLRLIPEICDRGMRYDLTVPFARYVVMNQTAISFPFKRSQIQPVWRAEHTQRGRYREFYQCDADVIGSTSLVYEAELIQIYDTVFSHLKLPVVIKINNRKILGGVAEIAGIPDKMQLMATAIDKLDKIGLDGVKRELQRFEIDEPAQNIILSCLEISNLQDLAVKFAPSETGLKGIAEMQTVLERSQKASLTNVLEFEITLARGLSYYTGTILEVKARDIAYGSIGGGGRYDDLTGIFGLKGVSGVGISFGADRIYDVMEEAGLFADTAKTALRVLFLPMTEDAVDFCYETMTALRRKNIVCEMYPDAAKFQKQMKYANAREVPFVAIIGEDELAAGEITLKNMATGAQERIKTADLSTKIY